MGVLKNIMVRAVADFSQLMEASRQAQERMRGMSNSMNRSLNGLGGGGISALAGGLNGVASKLLMIAGIGLSMDYLKDATNDAIQFDARMQTLNERLGQSSTGFQAWADSTGKSMGYSKSQIAEYGNMYSNMLYDSAKSQEDLSNKTTKMLEVSAILRSKIGMQQQEVSNRIRSAMNMEADGAQELGLDVRATAVEHSNAFKTMAGGVKAFSDLNSGMQKSIMYQYVLDEVTKRYGNTLAENAATKTARFTASLSDLKLSLGQAFLPIWTAVLPALTSLVSYLDVALQKVGTFMRLLFGYNAGDTGTATNAQKAADAMQNQASAAGDLSDAMSKAKRGVAGFDEVNLLPEPSGAAKGAGAGAPTGQTLSKGNPADSIKKPDEGVLKWFDDIMQRLKPVTDAWNSFTTACGKLYETVKKFAESPAGAGVIKFFQDLAVNVSVTLLDSLAVIVTLFTDIFDIIVDIQNGDWTKAMKDSKKLGKDLEEGLLKVSRDLILTLDASGTSWEEMQKKADDANKGIKSTDSWGGWITWWRENVSMPFQQPWIDLWTEASKIATASGVEIQTEWGKFSSWWVTNVNEPFSKEWDNWGTDLKTGATSVWTDTQAIFTTEWWSKNVTEPFTKTWGSFGTDLKTGASTFWTELQPLFTTEWWGTNVTTPLAKGWSMLMGTDGNLDTESKSGWQLVKDAFNDPDTWFKTNVTDKIFTNFTNLKNDFPLLGSDSWKNFYTAFLDAETWFTDNFVTPIKKTLGTLTDGIGEGLVEGFKFVYNKVAVYINGMLTAWNALTGSNPLTSSLQIPGSAYLPALAKGGITNGPMVAMIGDNPGGREVVAPLDRLTGLVATAVTQAMAFAQPSQRSSASQGDIILNIDGRTFARIAKPYLDDENKRTTVMLNRI